MYLSIWAFSWSVVARSRRTSAIPAEGQRRRKRQVVPTKEFFESWYLKDKGSVLSTFFPTVFHRQISGEEQRPAQIVVASQKSRGL